MSAVIFRPAEVSDCGTILALINELAVFEKRAHELVATEDLLREWLFEKPSAEVLLAEIDQKAVGYALFFTNFSTFLGRPGLYLEDICILPEYRHQGIGKSLFLHIKSLATERGYGRMEWSCLKWNQDAIDFYLKQGAESLSDWEGYRIVL